MKRDNKLFVKDILDAMEHIEEFAGNITLIDSRNLAALIS